MLVVAALGWLFDTMDQQLFKLARVPAMRELLAPSPRRRRRRVDFYGGIATCIFLVGWASGGLGVRRLGDRIGRAKTMLWTILIYSLCTGLSALSVGLWDFALYRFLTGLGVGGEFAVGVSLVAEVMPTKPGLCARAYCRHCRRSGNITAAVISMVLTGDGAFRAQWEAPGGSCLSSGQLPALPRVAIRRRLKEPERWQSMSDDQLKNKLGSYGELFGTAPGTATHSSDMLLAFSGVVGLWGIGFFSIDLTRSVFPEEAGGGRPRIPHEAEKDQEFVRTLILTGAKADAHGEMARPESAAGTRPAKP